MNPEQVLRTAGITEAKMDVLMATGGELTPKLRRELYGAPAPEVINLAIRIAATGLERYPGASERHVVLAIVCDKIHAYRRQQQQDTQTGYGD